MRADVLGSCLPHKCNIYIYSHKEKEMWGNRTACAGLRWFSALRWARVADSICYMLRGPWCSVTYGRWPKGMKIAPDAPVTKQHVIVDVLPLTDLDPQNFIAEARSSNPYPEEPVLSAGWVRNGKKRSLCADKMGWGKHSREESILQGVFLNPSFLLMPGWTPFSLRH